MEQFCATGHRLVKKILSVKWRKNKSAARF